MSRSDAMPLCTNCDRQPSQIASICFAANQDGISPEEFVLKYWMDFQLNSKNRFLCSDCREKLSNVGGQEEI